MLWCFWFLGRGVGRLDGIDWDEGYCEQLADTCDIAGTGLAREEAVVADAVEARWQDVHQEAADELVGIERHDLVVSLGPFEAVILPLEGNAVVVERDQAAVGDGNTVGIAGEVAQNFLGSAEGSFAVNHPVTVAQRRQIGREGSRICQRSVLAEEL
jgi:hypothetical protein